MPTRPKSFAERLRESGMVPRTPETRGTTAERGYGERWRRLRRMVLNRDPVCKACLREPSTDADHILAKAKGGKDTMDNLQGMCHACHSAKTNREDGGGFRPRARP